MLVARFARLTAFALLAAGLVGCGLPATGLGAQPGSMLAARSTGLDYFPLRASSRWTYQVEDKLNRVSGERSMVVRDLESRNGETASLVTFANGQEVSRQQVVKTEQAIVWDAYGLSLDLKRLDRPGRVSEKAGRLVNHLGFETIETPAGRFEKCLKIEIRVNERMGRSGQEYRKVDYLWLAPGVGPVKRVYEEGYADSKVGAWGKDLIVLLLSQHQR